MIDMPRKNTKNKQKNGVIFKYYFKMTNRLINILQPHFFLNILLHNIH